MLIVGVIIMGLIILFVPQTFSIRRAPFNNAICKSCGMAEPDFNPAVGAGFIGVNRVQGRFYCWDCRKTKGL